MSRRIALPVNEKLTKARNDEREDTSDSEKLAPC